MTALVYTVLLTLSFGACDLHISECFYLVVIFFTVIF